MLIRLLRPITYLGSSLFAIGVLVHDDHARTAASPLRCVQQLVTPPEYRVCVVEETSRAWGQGKGRGLTAVCSADCTVHGNDPYRSSLPYRMMVTPPSPFPLPSLLALLCFVFAQGVGPHRPRGYAAFGQVARSPHGEISARMVCEKHCKESAS